jgi:2'-5' RNA ligase
VRLFIAINLDPSLKALLADIQGKLKTAEAPVRWVKPEQLHLTLKFLGEVAEASLPALRDVLGRCLAEVSAFPLSFSQLGAFPPKGTPRVIWVGVSEGGQEVERVYACIEGALHPFGFPREDRPLHPHLTLGRVKGPRHLQSLLHHLHSTEAKEVGRMRVQFVDLMRSELHSQGAIYTLIHRVTLKEDG